MYEILRDCIDIHVHSEPGLFPRSVNDFMLAEEAEKEKMKAVVLKAHEGSSVFRASLVNTRLNKNILYGSIVLNSFVGGFNPDAVDCAQKLGARVIWMPTISAQNHLKYYGRSQYTQMTSAVMRPLQAQSVLDDNGKIKTEVKEIIEIARDNEICIATSHLSLEESTKLIEEALKMGLKKILLNHPEAGLNSISISVQKEFAKKGVLIEKAYLWITEHWKASTIEKYVEAIKEIGAESCVISTDLGHAASIRPVEGFAEYIQKLRELDLSCQEIEMMARHNPAWLLGI